MAIKKEISYSTGQKSLTRKQAESVISAANSYEDRLLVLIGFSLGLRRDDLVRIEIQNIDLDVPVLSYLEKKKGNRIKTVPLTERLVTDLGLYLHQHVKPNQKYLFPARQKNSYRYTRDPNTNKVYRELERIEFPCENMSSKTAYNIFNALCKKAGIATPIPIHAMRATCIKLKQEDGWTIEQVASLIGDKVATVQEHYSTPTVGELAQLMKERSNL